MGYYSSKEKGMARCTYPFLHIPVILQAAYALAAFFHPNHLPE